MRWRKQNSPAHIFFSPSRFSKTRRRLSEFFINYFQLLKKRFPFYPFSTGQDKGHPDVRKKTPITLKEKRLGNTGGKRAQSPTRTLPIQTANKGKKSISCIRSLTKSALKHKKISKTYKNSNSKHPFSSFFIAFRLSSRRT